MSTSAHAPSWLDEFDIRLQALSDQSLLRRRRAVAPLDGARMLVDGQPMLAFCSNDYLGLAAHPVLRQAAVVAVAQYGVGAGASPMVSGHSQANAALESALAQMVQLPQALYFYAGFATNASIVPALVGDGDALFSDALNHASLIDGARLSKAHIHRFPHADLKTLAHQLAQSAAQRKLVITDTVFSMDGDVADLRGLLALCEAHDALLLVDDAHGFGVLGPQGRGALAAAGLVGVAASPRVLYMATLSKAVGVAGAFVAGPARLVEWLLQKTRAYTYATAAPALLAAAAQASLGLILGEEGEQRRAHLATLCAHWRQRVQGSCAIADRGWTLMPSATAIQPLCIGGNAEALSVMQGLQAQGLWVPAIRPPTVPAGTARLRVALSAAHRLHEVDQLVDALEALAHHASTPWPATRPLARLAVSK